MPYSGPGDESLPKNVKGMSEGDRSQWVEVFNSAYKKCTDEDGADCEGSAMAQANGVVSKRFDIGALWESVKRLFAPLIDAPHEKTNEYQVSLPTITRSLTVTRAADGTPRWLMIAASAVINKVGAIDSTTLFDNFIRRANITTQYPVLDFYHEGDHIRFGVADWLCRDGALYLASGTFDDTDLARAAADGLESQAGYWGASIAYRITTPPLLLVNEGEIPVYTDGINNYISIVPKRLAANLFTATSVSKEVVRMTKNEFEELVKLVGAERAEQFSGEVDDTNRTITEAGMVTRAEETPVPETTAVETRAEETRPSETPQADAPAAEPTMADVVKKINELDARLAALEQGGARAVEESTIVQQRATDAMNDLITRLIAVETSKTKWDNWLADAPEHIKSEAENVFRARNQSAAKPTMEQVAAATTAKMKRGPQ
jgi:hypothetical protein